MRTLPIICSEVDMATIAGRYIGAHPDVRVDVWDGKTALPDCSRGAVYVVRDPRSTFVAAREANEPGEHAVEQAALLDRIVREHEHRKTFARLRIEDLCHDPRGVLTSLWKFLGLNPAIGTIHPQTEIARWEGKLRPPEHNQIVHGCATFLASCGYPSDPMPMVADAVQQWLEGDSIEGIPGGEERLRKEFLAIVQAWERTRRDLVDFTKTIAHECERLETELPEQDWARYYQRGEIASLIRCNDAVGHITNRALSEMMR